MIIRYLAISREHYARTRPLLHVPQRRCKFPLKASEGTATAGKHEFSLQYPPIMPSPFKVKFSEISPIAKVAVTWAGWATICLTGYYFARLWAAEQREKSLEVRKVMNDEFGVKLARAAALMESKENSARSPIKREE